METPEGKTTVVGALTDNQESRVTRIDEYRVDIPPANDVLILKNLDFPGIIERVERVLGGDDVHIDFYLQSRLDRAGAEALAAVAVDQPPSRELLSKREEVPDVLEVWLVSLDNGGGG